MDGGGCVVVDSRKRSQVLQELECAGGVGCDAGAEAGGGLGGRLALPGVAVCASGMD